MSDICYICREDNNNTSQTLLCTHRYHLDCIQQSIKIISPTCPLCQKYINIKNLLKKQQCIAILKSGKNKGNCCKYKTLHGYDYCGIHNKIIK